MICNFVVVVVAVVVVDVIIVVMDCGDGNDVWRELTGNMSG